MAQIFEIEALLEHRHLSDGCCRILVKWLNYEDDFNSWEPAEYLAHLDIYKEYLERKELKPEDINLCYNDWPETGTGAIQFTASDIISCAKTFELPRTMTNGPGVKIDAFHNEISRWEAKVYLLNHKNHFYVLAHDPVYNETFVADEDNLCIFYDTKKDLEIITGRSLINCFFSFKKDINQSKSFPERYSALIAREFKYRFDANKSIDDTNTFTTTKSGCAPKIKHTPRRMVRQNN